MISIVSISLFRFVVIAHIYLAFGFYYIFAGPERKTKRQNHCTPTAGIAFWKGEFSWLHLHRNKVMDINRLIYRYFRDRSWKESGALNWIKLSSFFFFTDRHCISTLWGDRIHQIPPWSSQCEIFFSLELLYLELIIKWKKIIEMTCLASISCVISGPKHSISEKWSPHATPATTGTYSIFIISSKRRMIYL